MKKVNIEKLYINKASYFLEDSAGSLVLLNVNYWEGKLNLKVQIKKDDNIEGLKLEAKKLAEDLLSRKSRVNFSS